MAKAKKQLPGGVHRTMHCLVCDLELGFEYPYRKNMTQTVVAHTTLADCVRALGYAQRGLVRDMNELGRGINEISRECSGVGTLWSGLRARAEAAEKLPAENVSNPCHEE